MGRRVDRPIFGIDEAINVMFAATNLSEMPIRLTELREDTVLLINGKEWPVFRTDGTPVRFRKVGGCRRRQAVLRTALRRTPQPIILKSGIVGKPEN